MKFIPIVLFILFCSCQKISPVLTGHWHVQPSKELNENFIKTLDFVSDTSIFLNKGIRGYGGFIGYPDTKIDRVRFGECLSFELSFELDGDNLVIEEHLYNRSNQIHFATKCDDDCCDKQAEFFTDIPVQIDLPIAVDTSLFQKQISLSLTGNLYFGQPHSFYIEKYGATYQLSTNNRLADTTDLPLFQEKHKIKIPEANRNKIRYCIYADKETPMDSIKPVLKYFKNHGQQEIYFAWQGADRLKEFGVLYQMIDLEQVDLDSENKMLVDFLEKNTNF